MHTQLMPLIRLRLHSVSDLFAFIGALIYIQLHVIACFAAYDDLRPHQRCTCQLRSDSNDNPWLPTHRFMTNNLQQTLTYRIPRPNYIHVCLFVELGILNAPCEVFRSSDILVYIEEDFGKNIHGHYCDLGHLTETI